MDKFNMTVSMSMADYEDLAEAAVFWQGRYNELKNIILAYVENKDGYQEINDCLGIAGAIEDYLNKTT